MLGFTKEAQEALHWWLSFIPQPMLIYQLPDQTFVTIDASTEGYGVHEQSVLKGQVARKEGQGDPHKCPRTRNCLESM